jgi:hypothetical protein
VRIRGHRLTGACGGNTEGGREHRASPWLACRQHKGAAVPPQFVLHRRLPSPRVKFRRLRGSGRPHPIRSPWPSGSCSGSTSHHPEWAGRRNRRCWSEDQVLSRSGTFGGYGSYRQCAQVAQGPAVAARGFHIPSLGSAHRTCESARPARIELASKGGLTVLGAALRTIGREKKEQRNKE